MPDNKLEIKLQVKNQKANKQLKDTSKHIKDVERKAKGSEKELSRMRIATAGLRRTMGALRNNLLLVSFAFVGVGAVIAKSVKAFGEQELAEKKLETALGRTSDALLQQASALQQVTTFGDENIIQAQALIAAFTDDEEAIKKATEATLDLAAAKGMDLFAAADLVAKTLGSSTNAMSRYGIEVTGAVGSTERLNTLTQNIANTFGGQAKAQAETMAGALSQAGHAAGDASEKLGKLLEPAIIKSAQLFKGASEAVGGYLDSLRRLSLEEIKESANVERLTLELNVLEKQLIILDRPMSRFGNTQATMSGIDDLRMKINELNVQLQNLFFPRQQELDLTNMTIMAISRENEVLEKRNLLYGDANTATEIANQNFARRQFLQDIAIKQDESSIDVSKAQAEAIDKASIATKTQTQMTIEGSQKIASSLVALSKGNKDNAVMALKISQAVAIGSAIEGSMTAFGKGGVGGFILGTALLAEGMARVQQINDQIKEVKKAETGMNEVVTQPTLILAGENNKAESVQITPLEGPNMDGPQGSSGITLNISAPLVDDTVVDSIIPAIREAVRRGEDIGIG